MTTINLLPVSAQRRCAATDACSKCKTTKKYSTSSWCNACARAADNTPERKAARAARARRPENKARRRAIEKTASGRRRSYAKWLRLTYNIIVEDVARAYERQGRACAGCERKLHLDKDTHVDHDHQTGAFRGLLCRGCNTALGSVKDNPTTLARLIAYVTVVGGADAATQ